MKLLQIGDTTINLDRVNHIDDNGEHISITFDNSVNFPCGSINFTREQEVHALRHWIAVNAESLPGVDQTTTGEPLGDPQPYTSPR